jgi:hypothetical protein
MRADATPALFGAWGRDALHVARDNKLRDPYLEDAGGVWHAEAGPGRVSPEPQRYPADHCRSRLPCGGGRGRVGRVQDGAAASLSPLRTWTWWCSPPTGRALWSPPCANAANSLAGDARAQLPRSGTAHSCSPARYRTVRLVTGTCSPAQAASSAAAATCSTVSSAALGPCPRPVSRSPTRSPARTNWVAVT